MTNLEQRLAEHFRLTEAGLVEPPSSTAAVIGRAEQRARHRNLLVAAAALLALLLTAAGALRLIGQDDTMRIESIDEEETDSDQIEQGLPASTGPTLSWSTTGRQSFWAAGGSWTGEVFAVLGYSGDLLPLSPSVAPDLVVPSEAGVYLSADGEQWEPAYELLDSSVYADWSIWSDGEGSVVMWSSPDESGTLRIVRSDDHGRTFDDLGEFSLPSTVEPPLVQHSGLEKPVVFNGELYFGLFRSVTVDARDLLVSSGLDQLVARFDGAGDVASGQLNMAMTPEMSGLALCFDALCTDSEFVPLGELTVDADVVEVLQNGNNTHGVARLSAGGELQTLVEFDGVPLSGLMVLEDDEAGAGSQLAMAVQPLLDGQERPTGPRLLSSVDGVIWDELELPLFDVSNFAAVDGTLVALSFVVPAPDPSDPDAGGPPIPAIEVVRSDDLGRTWEQTELWDQADPMFPVGITEGRSGLLLDAVVEPPPAASDIPEAYRIIDEPYLLDVSPTEIALVDLIRNQEIFRVDPATQPPFIITEEPAADGDDDDGIVMTILDPESMEQLMVVTASQRQGAAIVVDGSLSVFAWSVDGDDWGWQTHQQAFGIDTGRNATAGIVPRQFVIGDDRILAFVPEPTDGLDPSAEQGAAGPQLPLTNIYVAGARSG